MKRAFCTAFLALFAISTTFAQDVEEKEVSKGEAKQVELKVKDLEVEIEKLSDLIEELPEIDGDLSELKVDGVELEPGDRKRLQGVQKKLKSIIKNSPEGVVIIDGQVGDEPALSGGTVRYYGGGKNDLRGFNVVTLGAWIGVQVEDVTAPLRAHLDLGKSEGVMVRNIIKGSPADKAGLERFDVIKSVNGKSIKGSDGFMKALSGRKAGDEVKLGRLKKGKEDSLSIAFADRPSEYSYKYEIDENTVTDRYSVRGGRMLHGPDGWSFEYGPDVIETNPGDFLERLPNIGGLFRPDGAQSQSSESTVAKDVNGERVEVRRKTEKGKTKITVTRSKNGKKLTVTEYEDDKACKKADPEAYELLGSAKPKVQIHGFTAPSHTQNYDKAIRRYLKDKVGAKEVDRLLEDQVIRSFQFQKGSESKKAKKASDGVDREFKVGADGAVSVRVVRDGSSAEVSFKSLDAMRESAPELFKHYKKLLE